MGHDHVSNTDVGINIGKAGEDCFLAYSSLKQLIIFYMDDYASEDGEQSYILITEQDMWLIGHSIDGSQQAIKTLQEKKEALEVKHAIALAAPFSLRAPGLFFGRSILPIAGLHRLTEKSYNKLKLEFFIPKSERLSNG